jgi:lipoprotein-anchoring transpeptidase ErfK/SrfK
MTLPAPAMLDRRTLLKTLTMGSGALALGACSTSRGIEHPPEVLSRGRNPRLQAWEAIYRDMPDERFPIPAVDLDEVEETALRRTVDYRGPEYPGSLVIDTQERALFLVLEGGRAIRYGVGVGREGLAWSGRAVVGRKAEWPRWTPTPAMIAREPERNAPWASGMPAGLENPLGARALYLYRNNVDTLYRIHGTNEPWSIGQSVSSGCIRMINQDVIDLYARVPVGASVLVI